MRKLCAVWGIIVLLAVSLPGTASAAAATEVDGDFVLGLLTSPDPQAAFAALPAYQQDEVAELIEANLVAGETRTETAALTAAQAAAVGLQDQPPASRAAAAAAKRCWYYYYYVGWTLWGMEAANSWMQLNWCGSNSKIVSSSITNVGGAATLISYDGHTKSKRDVGWEVRGLTTHKFSFMMVSVTKCMQVRGGATGLYSKSVKCSLA